jgi:hypothetical protein
LLAYLELGDRVARQLQVIEMNQRVQALQVRTYGQWVASDITAKGQSR